MSHPIHEASDFLAKHGIRTIHDSPAVDSKEDIEIQRLRVDLSLWRHYLRRLAGPNPDGTSAPEGQRDPGYIITRLDFLARTVGPAHPEVSAVLDMVARWEARLPHEFDAVREEYLAWYDEQLHQEKKMFQKWQK